MEKRLFLKILFRRAFKFLMYLLGLVILYSITSGTVNQNIQFIIMAFAVIVPVLIYFYAPTSQAPVKAMDNHDPLLAKAISDTLESGQWLYYKGTKIEVEHVQSEQDYDLFKDLDKGDYYFNIDFGVRVASSFEVLKVSDPDIKQKIEAAVRDADRHSISRIAYKMAEEWRWRDNR